ncbi:MAG: Tryptophan 2,3-dioxygenase [uncultured Solirubrobacteraceae bacterium]|uniref:Tryptophan 2,3-dioxygenase n=1 Tax=uncultured Solirubrobacteraceae bacterium TaxID=1162706 RepID=A0A6J4T695_9ACTN|nr:MAG: Tryptophan 2,3-dioxygenase [uncultured Solirubrobacteraceae bacterium]
MPDQPTSPALTYASYLRLDDLLAAQAPRSEEHDELLFIVIHQVYELWFKQLIHELAHLQERLFAGDTPAALGTLRRMLAVLKTIVAQVDVLETLTPRGFLTFRDRLDAASGFQSAQFRVLEAMLGRRDRGMLAPYAKGSPERERIAAAMEAPDLFAALLGYLRARGRDVPDPSDEEALELALVAVYDDDAEASMVCEHLVDLDEGLQEWRYRHVQMVQRTIGTKQGTGGSAGADYLRTTLFRPVFPALWAIRSRL